ARSSPMTVYVSAIALLSLGATECDVLSWIYRGKGEEAVEYSLNHVPMGRGEMALSKCLLRLQQSKAKHLIIVHDVLGPDLPTGHRLMNAMFDKIRRARGATYLKGNDAGGPSRLCVIELAGEDRSLWASLNGQEVHGDIFERHEQMEFIRRQ